MKFKSDQYQPLPEGETGTVPSGTDDGVSIGGGVIRHEFSCPCPTNVYNILLGITVGGAGAGAGTGTLLTTVVNGVKLYKGPKGTVTKANLIADFAAGTFLAVHRTSILRAGSMVIDLGPLVDTVIAANGTLYTASMLVAQQLLPGTYTLEVSYAASTAASFPGFATPPLTVSLNVAVAALYYSRPVEATEIWNGNVLTQGGISVSGVREVYLERPAAIGATLNRMDYDISINAFGVQAISVRQAAQVLGATGAAFPFYRSTGDGLPHSFSASFTGAAAAITVVAIN